MPTTIISLFDDSLAMEKAIDRLNADGFEERVFEPANVAREVGHGVGPAFLPGAGPAPGGAGLAHSYPEDSHAEVLRTFRNHLAALDLSESQIEDYVTSFDHQAKFVIVTTDPERAPQAMAILQAARASRVHRHD